MAQKELCMPYFHSNLEENETENQSMGYWQSDNFYQSTEDVLLNDRNAVNEKTQQLINGQLEQTDLGTIFQEADHKTVKCKTDTKLLEQKHKENPTLHTFNTNANSLEEYSCMYCTKYEPIKKAKEVKKGDTVRFKRLRGVYNHFVVVVDVNEVSSDDTSAELTLVELKNEEKSKNLLKTKVQRTQKRYNFRKDKIEKAIYTSQPHTPKERVDRALQLAEDNEKPTYYDPFNRNCEHHTSNITHDHMISSQADSAVRTIPSILSFLLKLILKLGSLISKIPGIATIGGPIVLIMALCSVLGEIRKAGRLLKHGIICLCCYNEKHMKLIVTFAFSLIGLIISLVTGFHIATVCTLVPLGLLLPFFVGSVYNRILPQVQPAFNIPKPLVKTHGMVNPGDVITFKYYSRRHQGIVTEKKNCIGNEAKVKLTIVHFNFPGFGFCTVQREEIFFNLKHDKIFIIDFSKEDHYDAHKVVDNANKKVGSKDHNFFSYRSSNMARECKTGKTKLKRLHKKRANNIDEFSPGDIIQFKYYRPNHEAVVIKVEYEQKITCSVVHYQCSFGMEKSEVIEEDFEFDLSNRDLFVHRYKPDNVYSPGEVMRRARSKIGEKKFNLLTNRSAHLAKWCKVKQEVEECEDNMNKPI